MCARHALTERGPAGAPAKPDWRAAVGAILLIFATVLKALPLVILPGLLWRRALLVAGVVSVILIACHPTLTSPATRSSGGSSRT